MREEIINHRRVGSAEELLEALQILIDDAGEHPSTIYLNPHRTTTMEIALVETTLSDGSTVKDLRIREVA